MYFIIGGLGSAWMKFLLTVSCRFLSAAVSGLKTRPTVRNADPVVNDSLHG